MQSLGGATRISEAYFFIYSSAQKAVFCCEIMLLTFSYFYARIYGYSCLVKKLKEEGKLWQEFS
jgi:hypothetical protein